MAPVMGYETTPLVYLPVATNLYGIGTHSAEPAEWGVTFKPCWITANDRPKEDDVATFPKPLGHGKDACCLTS